MSQPPANQISPYALGAFHDGVVQDIKGAIPGDLVLTIAIGYLREMFEEYGASFHLHLKGCTRFRYIKADSEPTDDIAEIIEIKPILLNVASEQPFAYECVMGRLEIEYERATVRLDSGVEVSELDLINASERYWAQWNESIRSDA